MDFHTLARRDLQALCKKNKIPANITNVAMADALKALKIVEGIEEFMQQSQSGTTQSSIDSQEMPEVTSPFAPPTAGGRSTRCTNIPKLAPESVNPMTRTRRTARKTQVKDADAIETPAMVPQTNRKKGVMASARLNMDSQLKECADEGKKDFLKTPAVVTSRRKKAGESTVTRAYSTRRSERFAVNSSVEISNEVAKDGENEEMSLKEGLDNNNEQSEITDGDAINTVEDKSANKDEFEVVSIGKDEFEVVSDQKQDTSIVQDEFEVVSDQKHDKFSVGEEIKMESYAEEEICHDNEEDMQLNDIDEVQGESEAVSDHKHDTSSVGEEIKMGSYAEEEICDNEEDKQLNDINEVQQNDGYEIESTAEKSIEELKFKEGETSEEDEAAVAEFVENVILDSGDNLVVDEFYFDNIGSHDEEKSKEELSNDMVDGGSEDVTDLNVTLDKLTELTLQQALIQEADLDFVDHLDIPELQLNENELNESEKADAADPLPLETDFVDHLDIPELQLNENEPNESKRAAADPVPSETETIKIDALLQTESEKAGMDAIETTHLSGGFEGSENEPTEIEILKPEESKKADEPCAGMDVIGTTLLSGFEGSENEPTEIEILKPEEGAEICEKIPTTKSGICFSDNKENIGSGGKLVIMRDGKKSVVKKNVGNLDDLSVRQLTKMLKEKLEITKKSNKTEIGNEEAVISRTALQAISDNHRMVDGAGN